MDRVILSKTCFFVLIMTNYLFCAEKIARKKAKKGAMVYAQKAHYPSHIYHAVVTAEHLDPEAFKESAHYYGINGYDDRGLSPLHHLMQRSDTQVEYIQCLLSKGADPVARTKLVMMNGCLYPGETPYESAIKYGSKSPSGAEATFENQWKTNRGAVQYLFDYELKMRLEALVGSGWVYARKNASNYYPKDTEKTEK